MLRALVLLASTFVVVACSPTTPPSDSGPPRDSGPDAAPEVPDEDRDGISDLNEGRSTETDSDGDGTPDYLDEDSDGDGIPDAWESGTGGDASRAPRDTDEDGTPDFRDVDSDANGIFDVTEGAGDLDNDGLGDWADPDNDGDRINDVLEIGDNPSAPLDTDHDGIFDFEDLDSDDVTISDLQEFNSDADTDGDGILDRHDDDSDGDGIPDAQEAGDDNLDTPAIDTDGDLIPDYRDLDSDGDGLSDQIEWEQAAEEGTDYRRADSDGDGVSDMIEWAAGTGVGDPADSPLTRGDFVFVVPYEEDPDPEDDTLDFSTAIQIADVYFLMDRTGSMSEIGVMRSRLSEIIEDVTCAAGEDPVATGCIPDLWTGFGWFTESDSGPDSDGLSSYTNVRNLTADYAAVQAAIPGVTTSGSEECQRKAVYCAANGPGGSCPGDAQNDDVFPCPAGHIGYPCYRPDAARVMVLVTDEDMNQDGSPGFDVVGGALIASSITFVGINAEAGGSSVVDDHLRQIARNSGQPVGSELVFRGDDAGVVDTVVAAIDAAANVPFDVGATPLDDSSDLVDATLFIEYLEVNNGGAAVCSAWADVADSSGDGHDDRFLQIPPGTPVCWNVHAAINTFVEPTDVPQMFMATIEVRGGPGETLLDSRDVYFLVPPEFYEPPPD